VNRVSRVEELRAREAVVRRAPSAHNAQPWLVVHGDGPDGCGEVRIGADPARSLPGSDPTARDLALGIGALVESNLIVAAEAGLAVDAITGPGPAARLVPAEQVYASPFTAADLVARRVARGRYAPGPVPATVLAGLEPGLVPVPTDELAADLAVADRWLFATPVVARELRDWLRLHPRHPRYALDGLTDRALVLSRVQARLLGAALRAYPVTRRLGLPALLAAAGRHLLGPDGTVLVLTTVPGEDRVGAGRRLLRTWLMLGRSGLAVHPLSQLVDCPATAERLGQRLSAADEGARPLAVFRVGRPLTAPAHSARLPVPSG
jgi:hypothetical protein